MHLRGKTSTNGNTMSLFAYISWKISMYGNEKRKRLLFFYAVSILEKENFFYLKTSFRNNFLPHTLHQTITRAFRLLCLRNRKVILKSPTKPVFEAPAILSHLSYIAIHRWYREAMGLRHDIRSEEHTSWMQFEHPLRASACWLSCRKPIASRYHLCIAI